MVILGCIRGNIRSPEDEPRVLEQLASAMRELEQYADDREVAMVFEPINRYENNFLCSVADTAAFIRGAGLRRTKILMDTFHMNIEDPSLTGAIEQYGSDVAYVHIADSNRKYPGCGHTDFASILDAFAKQQYSGAFCAECHANGNLDAGCAAWLVQMEALLKSSYDKRR